LGKQEAGASFEELGITDIKVKGGRVQTDGHLLEILDARLKVDSLASQLGSLFKNRKGVKVMLPIKRASIFLI